MTASAQPMQRAKTLDELAYDYETAKQGVEFARQQLDDAERALLASVPVELEGSTTTATEFYKITTTGKLTRTLDPDALAQVRVVVPDAVFLRVIRFKPELSLRDYRYLEANEPAFYRAFADCITTKPAKTAIKVERVIED